MDPATRVFGDRYELRSLIATGGMGRVWRAHDQRLGRPVAVKVLRSEYAGDEGFLARFRAEARHTALLHHRNVVAVFDYGETEATDGEHLAYLVMELVVGESLADVVRREGALPADQVLEVVAQTAAGLAAAHEVGIVHRDVKPGNVLVRYDGSVAVTDFGIAWSAESVSLTLTGQVIGTAHYLSPEQAEGRAATPASDVYALGMVAYELLAGRRAFEGESSVAVALSQIRDEPPALPSSVPAPVRDLVAAMLVKDPHRRLADGDAVVAAVARARAGDPATAGTELLDLVAPAGVTALLDPGLVSGETPLPGYGPDDEGPEDAGPDDDGPRGRRRPLLLAGVLGALVLVGVGVALLLGIGRDTEEPVTAAGPTTTSAAPAETEPTVTLDPAAYVGRPLADVTAELTALGLTVVSVETAAGDAAAGVVVEVAPAGTPLAPGAEVTVTHTGEPVPAPASTVGAPAPTVGELPLPAPEPTPAPAPTEDRPGGGDGNGGGNGNGGNGNGNGNGGGRDDDQDDD